MNIAILICNKLSYECCGVGCFEAFNNKVKGFEIYKDEDVKLCGFMHCNGCGKDFEKELDYKINQLKNKNVTIIHMALCVKVECKEYETIQKTLEDAGFEVVYGTH